LIAHHTGKTVEEIEENTDRDNFMSAEQACEFNLIDKVVANIAEATA
jgi:ATP-dependent Clp protease protease subunit